MTIEYCFDDEKHTCESFDDLIKLDNYNNIIIIECPECNLKELPHVAEIPD